MDLPQIARVVWRFRALLLAGAVLGAVLATAVAFKVSMDGSSPRLEWRQKEMWVSYGRLLVTQSGFPQGRSDLGAVGVQDGDARRNAQQFADPIRFIELAPLYARLATSEPVRRIAFADGPIAGADSVAVTALENQPLVEMSATADSRDGAVLLAERHMNALRKFIGREQEKNGIAPANRISLNVIERPGAPAQLAEQVNTYIIAPRSPLKPALVFFTVCALFFGLAMVLENANPRLRAVPPEPLSAAEDAPKRSSIRSA
jgi:hypothetical protein